MITVNLKGGLGNQMFQYACGRALALRNGDDLQIVAERLEKANAVGDIYRPFSLQKFNIVGEVVPETSIPVRQKIKTKIFQKVFRRFYVGYFPAITKKKGDVFLDGFFQSEKYFSDFANEIRTDLQLKERLAGAAALAAAQIESDSKAVALHCRRGDYVIQADFGDIADVEYYKRAIAKILEKIPNAHFYIFSDDIDWCRENLPLPESSVFVSKPEKKDYEELYLMSICQYNIIANSTFSWWGAWLNKNPNKVIIAPTRWAHGEKNRDFLDIIPESWVRV